ISVIDGRTDSIVSTIPVGSSPYGIGANPNTNRIYVANEFSNTVSVIQGGIPAKLTVDPIKWVAWGKNITVTGKLTNQTGAGLGQKTVTFSGTGSAGLSPATTNPDGTFSATGPSPNTVGDNWK